jgi:uncharacterized membrane protein YqaE (UPF0057 family)
MDQVTYGEKCTKDNDCASHACDTMYDDNGESQGRFCISTDSEHGKECNTNLDCESGECLAIRNDNNQIIGRRCSPFDSSITTQSDINESFMFKDADYKYGVINDQYRDKLVNDANAGPIAKFMVYLVETFITIFKKIISFVWNIFTSIIGFVTNLFLGKIKGGIIFGLISNKHRGKGGNCFSMWLPRTIVSILLPPFGVYLSRGLKGIKYVLICCVLTCCFYFPGLIYAMIVMNNSNIAKGEAQYMKKIKSNSK